MVDADDGDGEATTSEEGIACEERNTIFGTWNMHSIWRHEALKGEVSGDEGSDGEEDAGKVR